MTRFEDPLKTSGSPESPRSSSRGAALLKVKRSTLGDRIRKLGLGHLENVVPDVSPGATSSTSGE